MGHVLKFTDKQVKRMLSDYHEIAEQCRDMLERTTDQDKRVELRDRVAEAEEIVVVLKRAHLPNPFENMEDMGKHTAKSLGITCVIAVSYDNDQLSFITTETLQHNRLDLIRRAIIPQIRLPYRVGAIKRNKEQEERRGEFVYTLSFYRDG